MKNLTRALCIIGFIFFCVPAFAQHVNSATYKPPKLITKWGNATDSAKLAVSDIQKITAQKLSITDFAGNNYEISSYQFLYKRVAYVEDEKTGKPRLTSTMVSALFRSSPLPPIWIKQITEELKPGEELYYFDVFVKDSKGRILAAPNLRILAQ